MEQMQILKIFKPYSRIETLKEKEKLILKIFVNGWEQLLSLVKASISGMIQSRILSTKTT
jgi:hypothetical protein